MKSVPHSGTLFFAKRSLRSATVVAKRVPLALSNGAKKGSGKPGTFC